MKKIDQIIVDKGNGDCTRACIASILEMDITSMPNFIEFGPDWFSSFWKFLNDNGCEYQGTGWLKSENKPMGTVLKESPNIDGFVIATVQSRTFEDTTHSVVMNLEGMVVHDPNPNKLWQGENILESGQLKHWMLIERI